MTALLVLTAAAPPALAAQARPAATADATTTVPAAAPAAAETVGELMYPEGLGADLGPEPTTLGLAAAAGPDPAGLATGELDGRTYWATDAAAGAEHLAFTPDAEWRAAADAPLTATLTYRDAGTGSLVARLGAEGAAHRIPLTGSDTWRTAAVELAPGTEPGADLLLTGEQGDAARDITVAAVRVADTGAESVLGTAVTARQLTMRAGDSDDGLVTGEHAGRGYWGTDRAAGTGFLYGNVTDTLAHDTRDTTVLVTVDYLDEADAGGFLLHYDSPGDALAERFRPSPTVPFTGSGEWRSHTFALTDAILTNRTNGGDFRIATQGAGAEIRVAAVRVSLAADALDPTTGLRALIDDADLARYAAREGDRDGQYPEGATDTLAAAIDAAREVADQEGVTEDAARAALETLHTALAEFRASAATTDLARGADTTASSGENPAAVVDGDTATAWTSGDEGAGEWLTVDLGRRQTIDDVRVWFAGNYSQAFAVQVSNDGDDFTTVREGGGTSANRYARVGFAETRARYVRVAFEGYANGATRQSVGAVEVRDQREVTPNPRLIEPRDPDEDWIVADFDVRRYGADPSGRRDSTDAIRRALYDCSDAGGGTVFLPEGTYRVTDTVEVFSFCTLRGVGAGPDPEDGDYGTVVTADLASGDEGPALFRVGGSAGVVGVTTWYPEQSAADPVPYNHTFEIPGRAWSGNENYMMSTVADVTMLNSYRGIGVSTMRNDRGEGASSGQVHESTTLRDIRGTVLYAGITAFNGADVGTWQDITLSNAYWAEAPDAYAPPDRAALDAWTRANGTGFVLGDLEWDQFTDIRISDYRIGIDVVPGQRAAFCGVFVDTEVTRTDVALRADLDSRWGLGMADSVLSGSTASVQVVGTAYVKVTDTELEGPTEGTVHRLAGEAPDREPPATGEPRAERGVLYPANAPRTPVGTPPQRDATAAIQRTLDRAARAGGGIVYLPAGWYRLEGHLRVPEGVELRGSSAVPQRDLLGSSAGSVLFAYEGRDTAEADTATALITLDGERAGVKGLRVFHPENNPADPDGLAPYPYVVRGTAPGTYVVNVGLPNAWNGVEMAAGADGFVVQKLAGAFLHRGITVGANAGGRVEGVLSNGNATARVGYALPWWGVESAIFPEVIDTYTRAQSDLVTVEGATGLRLLDVFGYGYRNGLVVGSGEVTAFNLGTDNLHQDGHTVAAGPDADVTVVNLMRYNGATSTGPVRLVNVLALNMVNRAVTATAAPEGAGTVTLTGNETEPGRYEEGSGITARAEAAPGYRFDHWTANGEPIDGGAALPLTVDGDLELVAHFVGSA
ncbi:discoidin domain-containing protein [Streptomyces hainanensis]|uniref:Coagulation factor 5/8 type domain-containing protein n=1 Tax=Streptomyces hainanensis TaxID=402648 RepID=A0A4R4TBX6_9ACTN|nr:glycosyl hydrolase family 28-related protein [Streptomyces hainanensis]TDC72313.1 coagulation factor 5/8 type domain-containing protein [Streptomyces hainanensis]